MAWCCGCCQRTSLYDELSDEETEATSSNPPDEKTPLLHNRDKFNQEDSNDQQDVNYTDSSGEMSAPKLNDNYNNSNEWQRSDYPDLKIVPTPEVTSPTLLHDSSENESKQSQSPKSIGDAVDEGTDRNVGSKLYNSLNTDEMRSKENHNDQSNDMNNKDEPDKEDENLNESHDKSKEESLTEVDQDLKHCLATPEIEQRSATENKDMITPQHAQAMPIFDGKDLNLKLKTSTPSSLADSTGDLTDYSPSVHVPASVLTSGKAYSQTVFLDDTLTDSEPPSGLNSPAIEYVEHDQSFPTEEGPIASSEAIPTECAAEESFTSSDDDDRDTQELESSCNRTLTADELGDTSTSTTASPASAPLSPVQTPAVEVVNNNYTDKGVARVLASIMNNDSEVWATPSAGPELNGTSPGKGECTGSSVSSGSSEYWNTVSTETESELYSSCTQEPVSG